MKRISLYVFWDKEGLVRDHVIYYLINLQKISNSIIFIVNGHISNDSKEKISKLGIDIFIRKNSGFDFYAWRDIIIYKLFNNLYNYDELILCNSSCYGPIYPFTDMFSEMDKKSCDFWGIFRHPACEGKYASHLQSYFLVLRNRLIKSPVFQEYWKNLQPAKDWNEAVRQETCFTKYFEDRGFHSLSYVNEQKYLPLISNPSVMLPQELIEHDHFPLLKRKAFTESYSNFFFAGMSSQGNESLAYIKKNTSFPVEYIIDDLIHTMKGSDLRRILHSVFILHDTSIAHNNIYKNISLIIFSYFEELIEYNIHYIKSMPHQSDIIIVVVSNNMKKLWEVQKNNIKEYNIEIRLQINRGRNESAYWLTCRDVVESHDVICVAHDKKTPSARPGIKGYYFSKHCWDNLLKSQSYVENILEVFRSHPQLGMLMPPPPLFSDWTTCIVGNEWAGNRAWGEKLYSMLDLHVPFDDKPDAPYGGMFWVRGKAMAPFYRYPWTMEDFPEEPLKKNDGTILHALERMYPMIVQEAGYYTGWVMPESQAGVVFDNLYFCLQQRESTLRGTGDVHFRQVKSILKAYGKKIMFKLIKKMSIKHHA